MLPLELCGIVKAKGTPAIVAWIPDWWVKSHKSTPTINYGKKLVILNIFKPIKTITDNNISIKYIDCIFPE